MKDAPELFEEDTNWIITETKQVTLFSTSAKGMENRSRSMELQLVQGNEVLKMKRVAFAILSSQHNAGWMFRQWENP